MASEVATTLSPEEIEERAREERRKARANWPVRKRTFEELDDDDEFVEGSGED